MVVDGSLQNKRRTLYTGAIASAECGLRGRLQDELRRAYSTATLAMTCGSTAELLNLFSFSGYCDFSVRKNPDLTLRLCCFAVDCQLDQTPRRSAPQQAGHHHIRIEHKPQPLISRTRHQLAPRRRRSARTLRTSSTISCSISGVSSSCGARCHIACSASPARRRSCCAASSPSPSPRVSPQWPASAPTRRAT